MFILINHKILQKKDIEGKKTFYKGKNTHNKTKFSQDKESLYEINCIRKGNIITSVFNTAVVFQLQKVMYLYFYICVVFKCS